MRTFGLNILLLTKVKAKKVFEACSNVFAIPLKPQ